MLINCVVWLFCVVADIKLVLLIEVNSVVVVLYLLCMFVLFYCSIWRWCFVRVYCSFRLFMADLILVIWFWLCDESWLLNYLWLFVDVGYVCYLICCSGYGGWWFVMLLWLRIWFEFFVFWVLLFCCVFTFCFGSFVLF